MTAAVQTGIHRFLAEAARPEATSEIDRAGAYSQLNGAGAPLAHPDCAPAIAVLLPCFNEVAAIAGVVRAFQAVLPNSRVYVFDNQSTDGTAAAAAEAGAVVRSERRQGKGNVVRRMFADVDADIYLLADGDGTYDARMAPRMIERLIGENLDMVVGARVAAVGGAFPRGHILGNRMFNALVAGFFGREFRDIFSGYRAFSRRFVKSFPAVAHGFDIETEMTVHALELRLPVAEVETCYVERPEGGASKLRTFRDGFRILWAMLLLFKQMRPFALFGAVWLVLSTVSVALAWPVLMHFLETGLVPRIPTAVLSTGMMIVAFLSLVCGLILHHVSRSHLEVKRLHYLSLPAPRSR